MSHVILILIDISVVSYRLLMSALHDMKNISLVEWITLLRGSAEHHNRILTNDDRTVVDILYMKMW